MRDRAALLVRSAFCDRRIAVPILAASLASIFASRALASDFSRAVHPGGRWVIGALVAFALVAAAGTAMFHTRRKKTSGVTYDADELKIIDSTFVIGATVSGFALLGVVAMFVATVGAANSTPTMFADFGVDLVVASASGAVGAVLGFIFGIPRTMDPASRAAVASAAAQAGPAAATSAVMAANTNLERVSDWLTTLLVGATLVQIREIPGWLKGLSTFVSSSPFDNSKIIPFVAVYFLGLSFLGVYLVTRLYLTTALTQTLAGLTGSYGVSDVDAVRKVLTNARADGKAESLISALGVVERWPFKGSDRSDPALNADLARALVQYLATGTADNAARRLEETRSALINAKADANVARQLKAEFKSGSLTTRDATKDVELSKLVD